MTKTKRLIVTGFLPFLSNETNPSMMVASFLHEKGFEGKVLKVSYKEVEEYFSSLDEGCPILLFGLAATRKGISLERYAYNETKDTLLDEDKIAPACPYVYKGGEDRVMTVLPVEDYKIALTEKGIEAYISRDPGRYLCNYAYYLALRKSKGHALFVHLPKVSEDLPLEDMEKAAEVLSNLIK